MDLFCVQFACELIDSCLLYLSLHPRHFVTSLRVAIELAEVQRDNADDEHKERERQRGARSISRWASRLESSPLFECHSFAPINLLAHMWKCKLSRCQSVPSCAVITQQSGNKMQSSAIITLLWRKQQVEEPVNRLVLQRGIESAYLMFRVLYMSRLYNTRIHKWPLDSNTPNYELIQSSVHIDYSFTYRSLTAEIYICPIVSGFPPRDIK